MYGASWGHLQALTVSPHSAPVSRSLTPVPQRSSAADPQQPVKKSPSTSDISNMAAVASAPTMPSFFRPESEVLNTIPDPRTPSPSSATSANGTYFNVNSHPELSDEVATLSTKLINAINHQTTLDDSLQATRCELDMAREKIGQLKAISMDYDSKVARGLLVKKEEYDKLKKELAEERSQRMAMEKDKRRIESELENLTTALFEEANTMVAAARKDNEVQERKNDQLKQQLRDTEQLLVSQQEQLQDLKSVIEQMTMEKMESMNTQNTPAPSTPGIGPQDKMSRMFEASNPPPNAPSVEPTPEHPLYFSHLIQPVLRIDLTSYREFIDMLRLSRTSAPPSRVSSGSYSGLNIMGVAGLAGQHRNLPSNGSSTSLNSPPPNSSPSSVHISQPARDNLPPLKDNPFYKRALSEDIEPSLRLDLAPGLSWLARRTVLNSMTTGSLVVEPHPPIKRGYGPVYACTLCGENRRAEVYARKYRFRTSDNDDAQRYPLCDFCLARVRSTCDYISFLRMVRDGHWRAESEEEQKAAWEESVRLRERMFWARVGGGVIPVLSEGPRSPTEECQAQETGLAPATPNEEGSGESKPKAVEATSQAVAAANKSSFESTMAGRPISTIDEADSTLNDDKEEATPSSEAAETQSIQEEKRHSLLADSQLHEEMRKSLVSRGSDTDSSMTKVDDSSPIEIEHLHKDDQDVVKHVAASIPGSFV